MDARKIQLRIDAAADGEELILPAGRFLGTLVISRPIVLCGSAPGTIIDAHGRGPALSVESRGTRARLQNITLTGGKSRAGGGLWVANGARVTLVSCTIEGNECRSGRGGGVAVERGVVELDRCTVAGNRAREGGGIFAGGSARVRIVDCMIAQNTAERGGGIAALDAADVAVDDTRFEHNTAELAGHHAFVRGSMVRSPKLVIRHSTFGGQEERGSSIENDRTTPGAILLEATALPRDSARVPGISHRQTPLH